MRVGELIRPGALVELRAIAEAPTLPVTQRTRCLRAAVRRDAWRGSWVEEVEGAVDVVGGVEQVRGQSQVAFAGGDVDAGPA